MSMELPNDTDTEATYLVWLDCRGLGLDPDGLERLFLDEAGVKLENGQAFGPGGEGFMRMNIACPRSLLHEALTRIAEAVARGCRGPASG